MQDIKDYILKTREERMSHIDLSEDCIPTKTGNRSQKCRNILSDYLGVTLPQGSKIMCCHACNNTACLNPRHMYWGTALENTIVDGTKFKTWSSPWERKVAKYGLEEAKRINGLGNKAAGGKGNKDKKKTEEHKERISEGLRRYWRNRNQ